MKPGRLRLPTWLRLLSLPLCLLAFVPAPASGANDNPGTKLRLLDISLGQHPISPANMDGRLDAVALDARFALRLTDGLDSLDETGANSNEKQFFVEWEWVILSGDGQSAIRVLERSDRVEPPFEKVLLDGPDGSPAEFVIVRAGQVWNGTDDAGGFVPDGVYPFRVDARSIRISTPGNPASAGVTSPAEIVGLTVTGGGDAVTLAWNPVTEDVFGKPVTSLSYYVYRGTERDFVPDATQHSNRIAATGSLSAVDVDGAVARTAYYLVTAVDGAGNESRVHARRKVVGTATPLAGEVSIDNTPPAVVITDPIDSAIFDTTPIIVTGTALDAGSGVVDASVNGVPATLVGIMFDANVPLVEGENILIARATDAVGNVGVSLPVGVELRTIRIEIIDPPDDLLVSTPAIDVSGAFDGDVATIDCAADPAAVVAATLGAGTFTATGVPLSEGDNTITCVATSAAGQTADDSVTGIVRDTTAPDVTIEEPVDGAQLTEFSVDVAGTVTDANPPVTVTCNGVAGTVADDGSYICVDVPLVPGPNSIVVTAVDQSGNARTVTITVIAGMIITLAIDTPENPSVVCGDNPITVEGTFTGDVVQIVCAGRGAARRGADGFVAFNVALTEGPNTISCVATGAGGETASASVSLVRDSTAPIVVIETPRDGAMVFEPTITVAGMVNDIVSGTVDDSPVTVTVNGVPAIVTNESFVAPKVPVNLGLREIVAIATDTCGNRSSPIPRISLIGVERKFSGPAGLRFTVDEASNGQQGPIGSVLPEPLKVRVTDGAGVPAIDKIVNFTVTRNDGTLLRPAPADGEARSVDVLTDAVGYASIPFRLGSSASAGADRVRVTSPSVPGGVEFRASATALTPARISVVSGSNQTGAVGRPLPLPFVVLVTDERGNPLANREVRFGVIGGGGSLAGDFETIVPTGAAGRAAAVLTLGPFPGINNNSVVASFAGLSEAPATFIASGQVAGVASETRVSGVVLDNADQPVPGVTLEIENTTLSTIADAVGRFSIPGAPVGAIRLHVDGSTATRPGTWPALEFNLVTVSGQDNTIGGPIRILPQATDSESSQVYQGSALVLTLPDVPGFELFVAGGSVKFPDGSTTGRITVTQVHFDKVPMPPPNGSNFVLAWTIQPANIHFDPPARISVPNNGLAPGHFVDMFSFDHDVGQFVSIGTASVTDDGSQIVSDPGFGIVKSGWGGCTPPPPPTTCLDKCGPCQVCSLGANICVPSPLLEGTACADVDPAITLGGINYRADDSCFGVCDMGACMPTTDGFTISAALGAIIEAGGRVADPCMSGDLANTMQACLTSNGFNVVCDAAGAECGSITPGSNTLALTPHSFNAALCDSLASNALHQMVHGCAEFRHRKCMGDGTVLGEISCEGIVDCVPCIEASTDKAFGCEAACFPADGSSIGEAAACQ